LQQVYFFNRRFEEAAAASEAVAEPDGSDALFATLVYAQLGRREEMQRWRSRLLADDPNFSAEYFHWRWGQGVFVLPQAAAEQALWLDSLAKAGVPNCATAEQIAASRITPLPECEAERAKSAAKAQAG
jgi:hypothetical protein